MNTLSANAPRIVDRTDWQTIHAAHRERTLTALFDGRHHDRYDTVGEVGPDGRYRAARADAGCCKDVSEVT